MRGEPSVDANRMEDMFAAVKLPHTVFFFKGCQTYDAFSLISALYSFCNFELKCLGVRLKACGKGMELIIKSYVCSSGWNGLYHINASVGTPTKHGKAAE